MHNGTMMANGWHKSLEFICEVKDTHSSFSCIKPYKTVASVFYIDYDINTQEVVSTAYEKQQNHSPSSSLVLLMTSLVLYYFVVFISVFINSRSPFTRLCGRYYLVI